MSRQRFLRYYLLFDYQLPTVQWGTTNNDKGAGGTSFAYPIACTPLSATASCTSMSVDPSDAAVTMLSNNSCNIDVKQASYTSAYRVIIIGQS